MISFEQVVLLQKKVESAVQKIVQLKAENDALRNQCSELTNALSEKTELLNTLSSDEQKIERTILDALERLNALENNCVESLKNNSDLASLDSNDVKSENSTSDSSTTSDVVASPDSSSSNTEQNFVASADNTATSSPDSSTISDDVQAPEFSTSDNATNSDDTPTQESHEEQHSEQSSLFNENELENSQNSTSDISTEDKKFDIF